MPKEHPYLKIGDLRSYRSLQQWEKIGVHKFCGIYEGCGEPLRLELDKDIYAHKHRGGIVTRIERLSDNDPIIIWRRAQEAEKKQQAADLSNRLAAQAAARHQAKLCEQVEDLRRLQHKQRNFLDDTFRANFLRTRKKQVLSEHRSVWEKEYDQLFGNKELLDLVKAQAPEVIRWHEARIDLIVEAERLELEPPKVIASPRTKPPIPLPPQDFYSELIEKVNTGQQVPVEPLVDRLKDLFREKIILEAKRRTAVRECKSSVVHDIDQRLEIVRKKIAEVRAAVEKCGKIVDLQERREPEQTTIEDAFFADYDEEQRIIDRLENDADTQTASSVRALYAERRGKLFQQDSERYT